MGTIHKQVGSGGKPEWKGVERKDYEGSPGATRQVLIGPDEKAGNFVLRYFEIPPGGASSLDRHAHDHGVYVVRGRADLLLGDDHHAVSAGDVIYIEPNETHQFRAADETFGFLCIVPPRDGRSRSRKLRK